MLARTLAGLIANTSNAKEVRTAVTAKDRGNILSSRPKIAAISYHLEQGVCAFFSSFGDLITMLPCPCVAEGETVEWPFPPIAMRDELPANQASYETPRG